MPLVESHQAAFGYRRRAVVAGVSCVADRGGCLGVYGPNGVGKTTLVRGLTQLLPPTAGVVRVAPGTRFGYLPQQRPGESHWPMSALDAASLASSSRAWLGMTRRARPRVLEQMSALGVADLAGRPFFELSGGQQQRVRLAGALAADPHVLLLDEPTGGLDARSRDLLLDRLITAKAGGLAVVLVSHDLPELLALADHCLLLEPAEDPAAPSRVENASPDELADRLTRRPARPRPPAEVAS